MVLRYLGEERGRSSRNLLMKPNCESRQRGKCVHEAVLSLCDMKMLVWGSVSLARKVRFAWFKEGSLKKQDFPVPFYHFMACSPAH